MSEAVSGCLGLYGQLAALRFTPVRSRTAMKRAAQPEETARLLAVIPEADVTASRGVRDDVPFPLGNLFPCKPVIHGSGARGAEIRQVVKPCSD